MKHVYILRGNVESSFTFVYSVDERNRLGPLFFHLRILTQLQKQEPQMD